MNLSITILTSLSALAVIFTIIFEGKLKKSNRQKSPIKVISEIKNVSLFGWVLILISVSMIIGNGYIAQQNIVDTNNKYTQDTIANSMLFKASNNMNKQLILKSINDSMTISNLKMLTLDNGLKSDSIKLTIVDNAVKTLQEQKNAIERERENIFSHFQNEVEDNLRKILIYYPEERIMEFADTNLFSVVRLNNSYVKKYELTSTKRNIIDHLMETAESIDNVNSFADDCSKLPAKSKEKRGMLKNFSGNVKLAQTYLYPIYNRLFMLNSFKEYESLDFSDSTNMIKRDSLDNYIYIDYIKLLYYK